MITVRWAMAAFGVTASCAGHALAQVVSLGVLPQGTSSGALAVSASGGVVGGYSATSSAQTGFRWTNASGLDHMGLIFLWPQSTCAALDSTGGSAAGWGWGGTTTAYRWTAAGGVHPIDPVPGAGSSWGLGISGDGSTVVGYSMVGQSAHPFRWTLSAGTQELPMLAGAWTSYALAANTDASVIVGYGYTLGGTANAWRWSPAGSPALQALGDLPGGPHSSAVAVSDDGTVICGYGGDSDHPHFFRWTSVGGMQDLGTSPQGGVFAEGMSRGGAVIVGRGYGFNGDHAFLWSAATGIVDLNTYLPTLGLDLTGWTLERASAANSDGTVLVGRGVYQGLTRAWRATLPAPCYANCDGSTVAPALNIADFTCFLQSFAASAPYANCDGSTATPVLNIADFTCFLQKFAAGCV